MLDWWYENTRWMRHPKIFLLNVAMVFINSAAGIVCYGKHDYRGVSFNIVIMLINALVGYLGYKNQDRRLQEIEEEKAAKRQELIEWTIGKE